MTDLSLRMNQALQAMRATEGTPYFERARAALAALVDIARKEKR